MTRKPFLKRTWVASVLVGAVAAMALWSGCNRSVDLESAQKFQTAQQAFDDARKPEDFAKVAAQYQEILDHGGASGTVLYNQGNAWWRAEQPARAIAAYRQAQRYLPRNPYLDAHLHFALGCDAPATRQPILETILFWQNRLSYPKKFYLALAFALATFTIAVASWFVFRRNLRRIAWVGLVATGVLVFSVAYDWNRFDRARYGVVAQPEVVARKGNAASYQPDFNEPLRESTEFRLVERRGNWLLIRLPGGGEGWIEDKAAVTY